MRPEYLPKYIIIFVALALVIFAASSSAQLGISSNPVLSGQPTTFTDTCTTCGNPGTGIPNQDIEIVQPVADGGACPAAPGTSGSTGNPPYYPSCNGGSTLPPCDLGYEYYTGAGTESFQVTETLYGPTASYPICSYWFETSGWDPASGQVTTLQVNCPTGSSCTGGPSTSSNPAVAAICNVYTFVNVVVFILALTLMILGGAIYAGAQILPGQARGQVQGYAMGMIMGGVAGAIIAVLAPYVLSIAYSTPINTIAICYPPGTT